MRVKPPLKDPSLTLGLPCKGHLTLRSESRTHCCTQLRPSPAHDRLGNPCNISESLVRSILGLASCLERSQRNLKPFFYDTFYLRPSERLSGCRQRQLDKALCYAHPHITGGRYLHPFRV